MLKKHALLILAANKLATDKNVKAAKETLGPGEWEGAVEATIAYDLRLGKDSETEAPAKAKVFRLLGAALSLIQETSKALGTRPETIIRKVADRADDLTAKDEKLLKQQIESVMLAKFGMTTVMKKGLLTGKAHTAAVEKLTAAEARELTIGV